MDLESRMKNYENKYNQSVKPYDPFVLKLDGVTFSTYTQGFIKPFDKVFRKSMKETMNDLLKYTNASTGYTQSDEIILIFPPVCTKEEYDNKKNIVHLRNGRVLKLCSVIASYCSTTFYLNIQKNINASDIKDLYNEKVIKRLEKTPPCFDCRLIDFESTKHDVDDSHKSPTIYPQMYEIINYLIHRLYDCKRNAILSYGEHYYDKKQILKIKTPILLEKLHSNNINIPNFILYGVYGKKQLYMKDNTQRSKITNKVLDFTYSIELLDLFFSKYWYNNINDTNDTLNEKYKIQVQEIDADTI